MIELINWLIKLEQSAGQIYREAALHFKEDKEFYSFLERLAEEEAWHFHILGSAADFLNKREGVKEIITLDVTTKEKIDAQFHEIREVLSKNTLTKESLLDWIVTIEYSEWNHIFLYVVNTLKLISKEFMYAASKLQDHMQDLEKYLTSLPEGEKYTKRLKTIPEVWKKKILIVDDFEPIVELVSALLENEGEIDTAKNGSEGLSKVKSTYFDVIISDIEMPSMDGVNFFNESLKTDPKINERFIFLTGKTDKDILKFIKSYNIRYLVKPLGMNDLKMTVHGMLYANEPQ